MIIKERYIEYGEPEVINVVSAEYSGAYKISIKFSDGTKQIVDFNKFLSNSKHPEIRKYLDEELFRSFDIVGGNLNWNDYELIFPVADLYDGQI
jgi:hypothetical protein